MTTAADFDVLLGRLDRVLEADRKANKARVTGPLERRLQTQLTRTWGKQRHAVIAKLRGHAGEFPKEGGLKEAIDPATLDVDVGTAVTTDPALVASIEVAATRAVTAGAGTTILDARINVAFGLEWPEATAHLADYGARRVTAIDEVTRRYLRTLLEQASRETWSYAETARAITERFEGFSARAPQAFLRNRAELVAVTEIAEAYEAGGRIAAERIIGQGIVLEKRWLITGNACPVCVSNAGAGWRAHREQFPSGNDNPPAHPACRCATERRVKPAERSTR